MAYKPHFTMDEEIAHPDRTPPYVRDPITDRMVLNGRDTAHNPGTPMQQTPQQTSHSSSSWVPAAVVEAELAAELDSPEYWRNRPVHGPSGADLDAKFERDRPLREKEKRARERGGKGEGYELSNSEGSDDEDSPDGGLDGDGGRDRALEEGMASDADLEDDGAEGDDGLGPFRIRTQSSSERSAQEIASVTSSMESMEIAAPEDHPETYARPPTRGRRWGLSQSSRGDTSSSGEPVEGSASEVAWIGYTTSQDRADGYPDPRQGPVRPGDLMLPPTRPDTPRPDGSSSFEVLWERPVNDVARNRTLPAAAGHSNEDWETYQRLWDERCALRREIARRRLNSPTSASTLPDLSDPLNPPSMQITTDILPPVEAGAPRPFTHHADLHDYIQDALLVHILSAWYKFWSPDVLVDASNEELFTELSNEIQELGRTVSGAAFVARLENLQTMINHNFPENARLIPQIAAVIVFNPQEPDPRKEARQCLAMAYALACYNRQWEDALRVRGVGLRMCDAYDWQEEELLAVLVLLQLCAEKAWETPAVTDFWDDGDVPVTALGDVSLDLFAS